MRQTVGKLLLVLAMLGVSAASPRRRRFVAVPLEYVQLIREARHTPQPPPPPPPRPHYHRNHGYRSHRPAVEPEPQGSSYEAEGAYDPANFGPEQDQPGSRFERQSGGGGGDDHDEYVDYGAHTGHHGSFGWYADFPVVSHGHR